MCELDSFICEYKKYYYELDRKTQGRYIDIFISRIPYSLSTSIREILKEFKDFCLIYIDDILIYSNRDLDDHFKTVELVLT